MSLQLAKKRLTKRFRAGVGAVILNKKGQVLAFERRDVPGAWQLPQGGLELGETVERALYREIREETGLLRRHLRKKFEAPVWIGYEYPSAATGTKKGRGQVHKWFFLELVGHERAIDVKPGGEFTAWRWCHLSELVDLVPSFRRSVYLELVRLAARKDFT
jgi:putative (di)nucleoside polyphosphate hydrolase